MPLRQMLRASAGGSRGHGGGCGVPGYPGGVPVPGGLPVPCRVSVSSGGGVPGLGGVPVPGGLPVPCRVSVSRGGGVPGLGAHTVAAVSCGSGGFGGGGSSRCDDSRRASDTGGGHRRASGTGLGAAHTGGVSSKGHTLGGGSLAHIGGGHTGGGHRRARDTGDPPPRPDQESVRPGLALPGSAAGALAARLWARLDTRGLESRGPPPPWRVGAPPRTACVSAAQALRFSGREGFGAVAVAQGWAWG